MRPMNDAADAASSSYTDQAYADLAPEQIIAALEERGYRCDGRFLALNSYENRVYQVGIDESEPVVAKFYRPDRWSVQQIQEEHDFSLALKDTEQM